MIRSTANQKGGRLMKMQDSTNPSYNFNATGWFLIRSLDGNTACERESELDPTYWRRFKTRYNSSTHHKRTAAPTKKWSSLNGLMNTGQEVVRTYLLNKWKGRKEKVICHFHMWIVRSRVSRRRWPTIGLWGSGASNETNLFAHLH